MPRCARVKSFDSIFHIMVRSISEITLFKNDEDKSEFLHIMKKYQDTYLFKVYAYCLMDNHGHFLIDASGADVSKFMHVINLCYAQYFNKKYHRHGHLFADRFKSKIVNNDNYLITVSGYIHNNPSDIKKYANHVESYPFSSLGFYIGTQIDSLNLIDKDFVLQIFDKKPGKAETSYLKFVSKCDDSKLKAEMEFKNEKAEYRSERTIIMRNSNPEEIVDFVSKYVNQDKNLLKIKYIKKAIAFKAMVVLLLKCYCDMTQRQICAYLGDVTQAYVSKLYNIGYHLMCKKPEYKNIMKDFLLRKTI